MPSHKGWFLKEWRHYRGLTQDQLSERIGVDKGYYSKMEGGKRRYNQDVLEALADVLDCHPGEILMRDPSKPRSEADQALISLSQLSPEDIARVRKILEAFQINID